MDEGNNRKSKRIDKLLKQENMKQKFIESVKCGDVRKVRLSLSNELLLDPRGKSFAEMLKYAKANLSNLFDENKEARYEVLPKDQWNEEFLFKVKSDLDSNFSVDKLAFYQAVIEVVGKEKMASLDKEEKNAKMQTERPQLPQKNAKRSRKTVSMSVATGGAVLTIVGLCVGKTLLTLVGGAVLIGGVLVTINDSRK